ncbi:hypothetical protein L7F22_006228 [Adiantum nelumboides]|nr:hypothetical protein [Adiantum nelumboides]
MAASAPVLGTAQDAPRPIPSTYELTPEDEMEMQTAIEHFSGRTLVGRLVGTTPSRPTVREWIELALGGSTARILELSMMTAGLFLLQLSDSVSTDALLARSPISSGSRLLVFQRWTPQFDQDEFDRQHQIPRFPVTLSFPSLPIFMRRCIPRMATRWGIVIPGSLVSEIGTPRIQVYAPGDTQFPDLVHIRDRAGQIRAQRMVVTGRPDQFLRCHAFGHHARACPRQPQARRQAQAPPPGPTTEGHDGKEWKRVGQDISRFLKADAPCQNSRPLRYSVLLDPLPTSFPSPSRLGGRKPLNLKDAVLVSYHQNEVKFSELTLDTFRFLQCLEWEPSGSFYRSRAIDSNGSPAAASMRVDDIMDQSLPPNPHKYLLHRPSILQLLLVLATACEELPADGVILLYLSALGKSTSSRATQPLIPLSRASASTVSAGLDNNTVISSDHSEGTLEVNDISPSSSPDCVPVTGGDSVSLDSPNFNSGLWFGSRADAGVSFLCPSDLFPFTRRPLFIIVDSDRSNLFEVIHGEERGEPSALLLSPTLRPYGEGGDYLERGMGSFFTFFLTAPLLAFCQVVNVSATTLVQGVTDQIEGFAVMADRPDDATEEVSSSQGRQTHEVGESSRPPQTDEEISRTQLVAAVTMFTQVMQNPRFMALLHPPFPSQPVGTRKQRPEPIKAQAQVIHTVESMETPVYLSETMQSPKPMPNVQEQVAETPVFQVVPVQSATFKQPIVGSNGQGSNLQAMQQVFPPPSVHLRLKALSLFQQFDKAYAGGNFTEALKVRKAATFLTGNAGQWWTTLLLQGQAPSTWIYFKQIFASAWLSDDFEADVMTEWHQLNAASCKNLDDYNRKFWKALLPVTSYSDLGASQSLEKQATAEPTKGPAKKWKIPFARKSEEQKQVLRLENKCFICEQPDHIAPNCPQRKRPADFEDKDDRKGKKPMADLVPDMVGDEPNLDASELCKAWGKVRDQTMLIFFDPGTKANFISPELASKLGIRPEEMGYTAEASLACLGDTEAVTPITGKLHLHIQSYVDAEEIYIMPLDGCDVLLGFPWIFRGTNDQLQKLLTSAIAEWGKLLSLSALDPVWVRIMWDPFLRQLLLRFIFCRACLALHRDYGVKEQYLPHCLPSLPKEFLPMEAAIEAQVYQIANHVGVVNQFKFSSRVSELEGRLESQNLQANQE